jgi:hypothetical protein
MLSGSDQHSFSIQNIIRTAAAEIKPGVLIQQEMFSIARVCLIMADPFHRQNVKNHRDTALRAELEKKGLNFLSKGDSPIMPNSRS